MARHRRRRPWGVRLFCWLVSAFAALALAITLAPGQLSADARTMHAPYHWAEGPPVGYSLADLQHYVFTNGSLRELEAEEYAAATQPAVNTVRLQVTQARVANAHFDPVYLSYVEAAVDYGRSLGLTVVINDQTEYSPHFPRQPGRPTQATYQFWNRIMNRYCDSPGVAFDLFNEPRHIDWQQWRTLFQRLVNHIRHRCSNTIWLEGARYSSSFSGAPKISGEGIVYSYHHPGAPWPGQATNNAWTWDRAFGYLADEGLPVVNGEFINSPQTYHLPRATLKAYLRYARESGIGMIVYGLGSRRLLVRYTKIT